MEMVFPFTLCLAEGQAMAIRTAKNRGNLETEAEKEKQIRETHLVPKAEDAATVSCQKALKNVCCRELSLQRQPAADAKPTGEKIHDEARDS